MAEWSDESDKVFCGCGVVSWTKTKLEGEKVILKEACPNCGKSDDAEVASIEKMSRKKAQKIVETLCEIIEVNPFQLLGGGGRLMHDVGALAQHLEDIGRVSAAERIRKVSEAAKGGFLKNAGTLFQKAPPEAKEFILKAQANSPELKHSGVGIRMVPSCARCAKAIMDYKPETRWSIDGFLCSECRLVVDKPTKIDILQKEIDARDKLVNDMEDGIKLMEEAIDKLRA